MWKCYKCKVDVEEVDDIKIFYKDLSLPDACGYRCPECGAEYLDGEFVADQLSSAEQMLEGK
ncbi:MAG: hypothetical protein ACLUGA_07755 [Oscillospiraceae bacterium]|mgnify:FL=1|jgi:hypothetical protein|nr:hypothetical protein [Oscillospiraceae bacterium]